MRLKTEKRARGAESLWDVGACLCILNAARDYQLAGQRSDCPQGPISPSHWGRERQASSSSAPTWTELQTLNHLHLLIIPKTSSSSQVNNFIWIFLDLILIMFIILIILKRARRQVSGLTSDPKRSSGEILFKLRNFCYSFIFRSIKTFFIKNQLFLFYL